MILIVFVYMTFLIFVVVFVSLLDESMRWIKVHDNNCEENKYIGIDLIRKRCNDWRFHCRYCFWLQLPQLRRIIILRASKHRFVHVVAKSGKHHPWPWSLNYYYSVLFFFFLKKRNWKMVCGAGRVLEEDHEVNSRCRQLLYFNNLSTKNYNRFRSYSHLSADSHSTHVRAHAQIVWPN